MRFLLRLRCSESRRRIFLSIMDGDGHDEQSLKLSAKRDSEKQPLTERVQSGDKRRDRDYKNYSRTSLNVTVTKQPKKTSLMSVTRMQVPGGARYQKLDSSPLLKLESDSDEDELFLSYSTPTANQVNRQLTKQLEKDGYRLDEVPDDEELDLIPPREFREARFCACCNSFRISCSIM